MSINFHPNQPSFTHPEKLPAIIRGRRKPFLHSSRLKAFMTTEPAQQSMVEGVLQSEETHSRNYMRKNKWCYDTLFKFDRTDVCTCTCVWTRVVCRLGDYCLSLKMVVSDGKSNELVQSMRLYVSIVPIWHWSLKEVLPWCQSLEYIGIIQNKQVLIPVKECLDDRMDELASEREGKQVKKEASSSMSFL